MTPMWKRRQRAYYELMWREAKRRRRQQRFIAGPLGWIVEVPHWLMSFPVVLTMIFFLSVVLVVKSLVR